jgi:HD superfamily phosphodiesterase
MTLEQATDQARAAVEAGDLDALGEALKARAAAMKGVQDPARIKAAIEAGESVARDLRLLRLKLRIDTNRLTQIHSALLTGLGAGPRARLNCKV